MNVKRLFVSLLIWSLLLCTPMYAFAQSASDPASAVIRLEADGTSITEGDRVTVRIVARNAVDLYGVQVAVRYDSSKLDVHQVSPQGGYNDFGGKQVLQTEGKIMLPLLREGASSPDSAASSLTIAVLDFTARNAGTAELSIDTVKAVTSESYIHASGYKDLKELAVVPGGKWTLHIGSSSSSSEDTAAPPAASVPPVRPDVRQSLQDLEKKLDAGNPEQALAQLSALFSGGAGSYSPAEVKQLEKLAGQLQQQLRTSVKTTADPSTQSMMLDNDSLAKAVRALQQLSELAASNKLDLPTEASLPIRLADGSSPGLLVSPEQAKQLEGGQVSLLLENGRGAAFISYQALADDKGTLLQFREAGEQAGRQADAQLNFVSGLNVQISTIEDGKPVAVTRTAGQLRLTLNYDESSPQAHKLGVYVWNEAASSWEYVRKAKPNDGKFEVAVDQPGVYALMEFEADYKDIGNVYNEARHAIEALAAKHYMFGTGEAEFAPSREMTRAEFVALLVRILDLDSAAPHAGSYSDVAADAWYAGIIHAARQAGIVHGDGVNFDPDGKLTREQMAVLLVNSGLVVAVGAATDTFADDESISDWAKEAVYAARASGLIQGVGDNTLSPKASANRADVAVLLLRLIEQR
ncbi:S-layer homology domain-containing protein [Paenibacillus sp. GYB004]|uniref:S-layer homology domain-containing protein n=1 Tax=Paenibacillus sp. GYB004 TaxID=2994393 RepID=UPI002F967546